MSAAQHCEDCISDGCPARCGQMLNLLTLWPILAGMAEPPTEPPKLKSWTIYKIAGKAIWLGTVEAGDKAAAIKKAAQEFKTEVWRPYAVPRR